MLSTMHHDTHCQPNVKKTPDVVAFCSKTKGGVDCADQIIESYSTKFATRRWPVVAFCNLLDIAALNAYVLCNENAKSTTLMKRRLFLHQLGKELCHPWRNECSISLSHPKLWQARQLNAEADIDTQPLKRGRCCVCPQLADTKTAIRCTAQAHCLCWAHNCLLRILSCRQQPAIRIWHLWHNLV